MSDTPSGTPDDEAEVVEEAASAASEDDAQTETVVDARDSEASAVEAERDAYRDSLQRLQADFENYRKRMTKQQAEAYDRATEGLVAKLLPVLDTLDLAAAHEPEGSVGQVAASLGELLRKEGLDRILAVDQPFDPTLHEAVAHEPGEGESRVSEELRAGYWWKGRVIRPAMVKVIG